MTNFRDQIRTKAESLAANALTHELIPHTLKKWDDGTDCGELVFIRKCNRNEIGLAGSAAGEVLGGGVGSGMGWAVLVNLLRFALVDEQREHILESFDDAAKLTNALSDEDVAALIAKVGELHEGDLHAPDTTEGEEDPTPLPAPEPSSSPALAS